VFEEKQLDLVEFEVLQAQTHLHQKCKRDERPQESLKGIDSISKKKDLKKKVKKKKRVKKKEQNIPQLIYWRQEMGFQDLLYKVREI
jgi:hypothetical protein